MTERTAHVDPPDMASWNLALRFVVELAALIGLGAGGWTIGSSAIGLAGGVIGLLAPIAGAVAWGTFNVAGDPSRSGRAPVPVSGAVRLGIEASVFVAGAAGWWIAGYATVAVMVLGAAVITTVAGHARVRWLLTH